MEPYPAVQLTQPSLQGLPPELKIKIIEYAIANYELSDSKNTFCALNGLNRNFHSLMTAAHTLKKLIQVMANSIDLENTSSITNRLRSIPVVTTQQFQEWHQQEAERINKEEEFLTAVQWCGNLDQIKKLIEHVDINARDSEGRTAVYLACKIQNLDVLNLLLKKKANINKPNKFHVTPLKSAVFFGNLQFITVLLTHGADSNYPDLEGWTPLFKATFDGNISISKTLLEANANINTQIKKNGPIGFTALMWAVNEEDIPMIKLLLQYNPNLTLTFKDQDSEKNIFDLVKKSPKGKRIKNILLAFAKEKGLALPFIEEQL